MAAGLAADPSRRNIPDEELFDNLREAWIQLGRQPRRSEMGPPISRFGREPYVRRFGSWLAALRAFVGITGSADQPRSETAAGKAENPRYASLRLRFQVMQRDSFRCVTCGRSPATHTGLILHLDHVVPFSKGGRTELANLRTTCADCNLGKGDAL
ncbi:MAG: HNH endonuclease [Acidobacteria bacterium]|nr:HNH endonuclease [Acidobacteriota bacterium]